MRRITLPGIAALTSAAIAGALLLTGPAAASTAPPAATPGPAGSASEDVRHADAPSSPMDLQRQALRRQALEHVAAGSVARSPGGTLPHTVKIGKQYAELAQERTDKIFVILAEFGDQVDSTTMNNGQPRYGGEPGPLHNTTGRPAKADNHTVWRKDFDRAYYQQQFFGDAPRTVSLRNFYRTQSSGRYDIEGTVTDWVKLPWNEARYGSDNCPEGQQCHSNWDMIRDATTAWYDGERAKGRTPASIKAQIAQYDHYDRYDFDHDGNFDEPDGYIDHLVVVHAGKDQTWGGGTQGTGAVWAHRWFAYYDQAGQAGPQGNRIGGTPVGDTGIWAGDYLTGGENSGVGLFAHEYGHDLGLPDLYGATGDNSVNYWSLMSSASYLGKGPNTTGDYPGDLDAWSKLQLGWLAYEETASAAPASTHRLGVSSYNTADPQGLLVHLPPSTTTTELTDPYEGGKQWWSGTGDFLDSSLTRTVDLRGVTAPAVLDTRLWYDIEKDYDFFTVEASTDGGSHWTALPGTVDGTTIPRTPTGTPVVTGTSGAWTALSVPLDAYAGQQVQLRFHVTSDSNTHGKGVLTDAVSVSAGGTQLFADGAEAGPAGWTAQGFTIVTGRTGATDHPRAYIVENRRYTGYGAFLKTGPYNFGWSNDPKNPAKKDTVEFYPYQQGALIWLWDTAYSDNTTANHPGGGLLLPIDARPAALRYTDGTVLNARAQTFDATFSLGRTDRLTFHKDGVPVTVPSRAGVPVFNDHTGVYWNADLPQVGVKVPDTGTRIAVTNESHDGRVTTVRVSHVS
ncbi:MULTISPECIES: immune inhibitor A domain-containing protein [unclassified Streptomyces]|uniref:immune inhibitor A domain-containing protein n=1 Tax=unclassified Streptomyces TaxID=2593676 RepID=UPI001EF37A24|nr:MULTISPECIES: immune inhibitor A domain-containing protein [unclassified Streptomyces]